MSTLDREPAVDLKIDARVAVLTLNRPAQRNALSPDLIEGLSAALTALAQDEAVNVVVITARGPAFCSGLDLAHLGALSPNARRDYMRTAFTLFEQVHAQPQPTIAAINGPAVAGGFDLAVFCDLRLCVPAAKFAQPEVMLGATQFIYPAWTLIGLGRARELALSGEPICADEAYRIGLVNHLVQPEELMPSSMSLAKTLASRPRAALLETKRLGRELPGLDREAAMRTMGEALDRSLRSEEHRLALQKYLARSRGA